MKNVIQILMRQVRYRICLLLAVTITFTLPSFAGSWSTEDNLSGMDSVHIYLPKTSPLIDNKRALMINLHGCDMKNTDMKKHADWTATADKFGMVVALPDTPGSSYYNCWDYYGENHTRTNKYNNEIIQLANELIGRTELNIDPNQVYITGFSSGGGQANVIACLAPDIFAGVGSLAGPGLGTTPYQFSNVPNNYSSSNQAALCKSLASNYSTYFSTQIYSTLHGLSDNAVDPDFNVHGADIMANVYSATSESSATSIAKNGTEVIFSDGNGPRVSKISIKGMGHVWSTKNGGHAGYFINNKVDYPSYVTQWFFDNNRRIGASNLDEDIYSEIKNCDVTSDATETYIDEMNQICNSNDSACTKCAKYIRTNASRYNAFPRRATY